MRHFFSVIQTPSGTAVSGASIDVYNAGGTVHATIYSDDGITSTPNPLTSASDGTFGFYVADGRYDLKVSGTGITIRTFADVEIFDATEKNAADGTLTATAANFTTLTVTGTETCATLNVSGVSTVGSSTVTGNETVGGTLQVTGATTLNSGTLNGTFGGNPTLSGNVLVGGTLGVTGDTSLTGAFIPKGSPYFDVRAYGAVCDGVTDDTTAIQSALTAAAVAGGLVSIPDGKICVVASSAAIALNLDTFLNVGLTGGIPGFRSRPGGGTTASAKIKFTGTPTVCISARSTFGFALSNLIIEATNVAFSGTMLDMSHNGIQDSTHCVLYGCTFSAAGTACSSIISFDKTIESTIENCSFFGGVTQIKGASASGSYSNVIRLRSNEFNAFTGTTAFIVNPGEAWSIIGNTFEINAISVATLANSGGFGDTVGLFFTGNWDGDDTGVGAFTKYTLPANSTGVFYGNLITATHNNVTGFSIGNNACISICGNYFAANSTFGTLYSIGTGDILEIVNNQYSPSTISTFISGTPSSGRVQNVAGVISPYGVNTTTANSGNTINLLNFQDAVGPLTGNSSDQTVYTYTLPGGTMAKGKGIRVKVWWVHGTGTASITYKLSFGAQAIVNSASAVTGNGYAEAVIMNTTGSTSSQRASGEFVPTGTAPVITSGLAPSETTASNVTVKFTFNVANTDQLTGAEWVVELIQ